MEQAMKGADAAGTVDDEEELEAVANRLSELSPFDEQDYWTRNINELR